MKKVSLNRREWLLLILGLADGKELSPVQLQKSAFLVGEELKIATKGYYNFKPYDYGPFSDEVYKDAEELASENLVNVNSNINRWKTFSITLDGSRAATELTKVIDTDLVNAIREKVEWVLGLDFRELVLEIYRKYPKYRANSVFRG